MSLTISINVRDAATPFVVQLGRDAQPGQQMNQYIADAATNIVERKFVELASSEQNVLKHTGFWNRMLSGTFAVATDDMATVRMPREVAQRFFGGTIEPIKGTYLAIPLRSEAVGKSPRDFNDLRFIPPTTGVAALLVQREQTQISYGRKRKDGSRGSVKQGKTVSEGAFYALVRSVTQRGNDDVLPTDEEFGAAATQGIESFIKLRHG